MTSGRHQDVLRVDRHNLVVLGGSVNHQYIARIVFVPNGELVQEDCFDLVA